MLRALLPATAIAAALLVLPPSAAQSQNLEPIKERKALLKEMGKATKDPGAMLKQEVPFDLAAVKAALAAYKANAPKIAKLFPDDARTGGETEALPAIWENKDDFTKRFDKLVADATAAEGKITDEFSFQEEFPKVVGNCGGCHKQYREKK
jgi:cytochrome c556